LPFGNMSRTRARMTLLSSITKILWLATTDSFDLAK
jgi:hypothetical protein